MEDLLENVSLGLVWCHVLFSRALAHFKARIINKIGELIRDHPDIIQPCVYVADFEQASSKDPDLFKIFKKPEDLATFQKLKVVEIVASGSKGSTEKFVFNIAQPDVWFGDQGNGLVKAMIKNIPKGWSDERCLRLLDRFKAGKKATRGCVKEAKDSMHPKHSGGLVPRGMLMCTVIAHDDDPEFKQLKSVFFVPFGKARKGGFTVYVGCTAFICGLKTHLAEVHEKWADRIKGMKRWAAIGLIKKAKRRNEGLPESETMKSVVKNPKMEFVADGGLGKQAWRCTSCKTGSGEAVCGESFSQALKHQLSAQHIGGKEYSTSISIDQ